MPGWPQNAESSEIAHRGQAVGIVEAQAPVGVPVALALQAAAQACAAGRDHSVTADCARLVPVIDAPADRPMVKLSKMYRTGGSSPS